MSTFSDYENFDALGLAHLIKAGIVTPAELVTAAIEKIEVHNPALNAVITKAYDLAQSTAKKPIPAGVFQGVPFLLKDLMAECAGIPMFFGSSFLKEPLPRQESELVRRMKNAGLIMLGKTNTPEFGLSALTDSKRFGPTKNPWNTDYHAGGSSGGSAAAVAARMVPMAHGGDGAGSIRIPAAFCGLFGLKPSRGRTPTGPDVMQYWQGMVVEHVITRSVRDSAAMLDVLAGPELGSPIALPSPAQSFLSLLDKPSKKLRIAYCEEPFFPSVIDPEYQAAFKQAAQLCETLGHSIEHTTLNISYADVEQAFMITMTADTAASINLLAKAAGKTVDYAELETITAVLCKIGARFSAEDFVWAKHVLDMTGRQLAEFLLHYDVLLSLTMAAPPPLLQAAQLQPWEKGGLNALRHFPYGPLLRKLSTQLAAKQFSFTPFTPLFNMTGQPAMSVPLYWDKKGLPIGIQFAGRVGEDALLLRLAKQLEEAQPWGNKKPGLC